MTSNNRIRSIRKIFEKEVESSNETTFQKPVLHKKILAPNSGVNSARTGSLEVATTAAALPASRLVSPTEQENKTKEEATLTTPKTNNSKMRTSIIFQDEADSDAERSSPHTLLEHAWESAEALLALPLSEDPQQEESSCSKDKERKKDKKKHKKKYKVKESKVLYSTRGTASPKHKSSYRIYMLLLQPQERLFELIQLVYDPKKATIGDLIDMIPHHATEPALAQQSYVGITRPHRHASLYVQLSLSASNENERNAGIQSRDILVAIPRCAGVDSSKIIKIAKQILASPSVQTVVEPKIDKKKKKKDLINPKTLSVVEEDESATMQEEDDASASPVRSETSAVDTVAQALERIAHHIKEEPKTTATPEKKKTMTLDSFFAKEKTSSSMSSVQNLGGQFDEVSVDDSLSSTYSNWSQSFERSLSSRSMRWKDQSSVCSANAPLSSRERRKQHKRTRQLLQRVICLVIACMVAYYYADANKSPPTITESSTLGIVGFLQFVLSFWLLRKVQRFYQSPKALSSGKTECYFLQLVNEFVGDNRIHVSGVKL